MKGLFLSEKRVETAPRVVSDVLDGPAVVIRRSGEGIYSEGFEVASWRLSR